MQDPELVNQLKERLPEALFEKLNGSLSIDRDRLRFAEYKVRVLEERLRLVRIEKYGPGSEKLSDAQLELLGVRAWRQQRRSRSREPDEKARKENLNPSDRHLLRLEKAKPLLEQIKTARGDALPNSAVAKACNYTLRRFGNG